MKVQQVCLSLLALAALATSALAAAIPTNFGVGADAEVRESTPTTNRGSSTELATRILDDRPAGDATDGSDRNSAMYLKFDITGQTFSAGMTAKVRLTYRNNNLTNNRVTDTASPNPDFRTGLAFYGLDRDHAGNNWDESTITYLNAPGIEGGDFNVGTKDYQFLDPDGGGPMRRPLSPLGIAQFPAVLPQNHLPVGGALVFSSPQLTQFILDAVNAGKSTVTVVAGIAHDGKIPINDWKNFNYLFNPKEQTTLNADTNYDADSTNPDNPLGSPWSAADNSTGAFSPTLLLVPEPSSLAIAAVGALALSAVRRRR